MEDHSELFDNLDKLEPIYDMSSRIANKVVLESDIYYGTHEDIDV